MTESKQQQNPAAQTPAADAATSNPEVPATQESVVEEEFEYREVVAPEGEQDREEPARQDPAIILQQRLEQETRARLAAEHRNQQWDEWYRQEKAKEEAKRTRPISEAEGGDDSESSVLVKTLQSLQESQQQLREDGEQLRREVMESRTMMARMHIGREIQEAVTEIQKEHGQLVDAEDVSRFMRRNPDLSPKEAAKLAFRERAKRLNEAGYVRKVPKPKPAPRVPGPHEFRSPPPFSAEPLKDREKLGERLGEIIDHVFKEE